MRRLGVLLLALALAAPAAAFAAAPRASLTDLEDEVMCTTCNVPLNVAESPQADQERAVIRKLIDRGLTKEQIKDELVAEYGDDVLAEPSSGSLDWLVPVALVAALLLALALLVPRWRRRSRGGPAAAPLPALSGADARRLDEDLARYDR
jgi:cytochrome c-type biogenesis protein CcmH